MDMASKLFTFTFTCVGAMSYPQICPPLCIDVLCHDATFPYPCNICVERLPPRVRVRSAGHARHNLSCSTRVESVTVVGLSA